MNCACKIFWALEKHRTSTISATPAESPEFEQCDAAAYGSARTAWDRFQKTRRISSSQLQYLFVGIYIYIHYIYLLFTYLSIYIHKIRNKWALNQ